MMVALFSLAVLCCLAGCETGTIYPNDAQVPTCDGVTCTGHGSCSIVNDSPTCTCETGYHAQGLDCVSDTDPCQGVTCSGQGTCSVSGGNAACTCNTGYHAVGLTCVQDSDPCQGITCSGQGTCSVSGGNAVCTCNAGYHAVGLTCVPDDPCLGVTCSGHGTCSVSGGNAVCTCEAGYHSQGLDCVADGDPCQGVDCSGHGSCSVNGGNAVCTCDGGYHAVGLTCVSDVCTNCVQLSWEAPTLNTDDTPCTDLAGYRVYQSQTAGQYTQGQNIGMPSCTGSGPTTCTHRIDGLAAGAWYFKVTAYDTANNESPQSNEASFTAQ
jgi:hypothetical protein